MDSHLTDEFKQTRSRQFKLKLQIPWIVEMWNSEAIYSLLEKFRTPETWKDSKR